MKSRYFVLFLCASSVWAQAPAAASAAAPSPVAEPLKPDTVVAVVNGKSYTAEQMDRLLAPLAPTAKAAAFRDPQNFLDNYALFDLIGSMAEKSKLDQKSPFREQIAETRRQILVTAYVNEYKNSLPVPAEDQRKYYDDNIAKYKETKVKMIFIPFSAASAAGGKKPITEAEAKAKAESVVKLARSGVDFVKLVQEHSEDPGTKSHDGDLGRGVRAGTPGLADNVKSAILALKPGEISDAIHQQSGYVVVRAESISVAPYEQVKDEIFNEIKDAAFRKYVDETRKQATVKIENGSYFQQPGGPK
jgi:parvulin-like peptidyl-prolyl isomerase